MTHEHVALVGWLGRLTDTTLAYSTVRALTARVCIGTAGGPHARWSPQDMRPEDAGYEDPQVGSLTSSLTYACVCASLCLYNIIELCYGLCVAQRGRMVGACVSCHAIEMLGHAM